MSPGGQAPWVSIKSLREDFAASEPIAKMLPWGRPSVIGGSSLGDTEGWTISVGYLSVLTVLFPSPPTFDFYHNKLFSLTVFIRFTALKTWAWNHHRPQLSFGQLVTRIIHTWEGGLWGQGDLLLDLLQRWQNIRAKQEFLGSIPTGNQAKQAIFSNQNTTLLFFLLENFERQGRWNYKWVGVWKKIKMKNKLETYLAESTFDLKDSFHFNFCGPIHITEIRLLKYSFCAGWLSSLKNAFHVFPSPHFNFTQNSWTTYPTRFSWSQAERIWNLVIPLRDVDALGSHLLISVPFLPCHPTSYPQHTHTPKILRKHNCFRKKNDSGIDWVKQTSNRFSLKYILRLWQFCLVWFKLFLKEIIES